MLVKLWELVGEGGGGGVEKGGGKKGGDGGGRRVRLDVDDDVL